MDPKTLDQARAMITWGETPESVKRHLLSNDVSAIETRECVALLFAERHREIRWNGVRKTLIGIACLALAAVAFHYLWPVIQTQRRTSWILTLLLATGGFGLWRFIDGLIYLIRPELERKALSELSD